MLYLAPYEGSGTKSDPFRPKGSLNYQGWGAVDLRPDPKVADGYCLFLPPTTADLDQCLKLAVDKAETTAASTKTQLGNRLSINLSQVTTVESLIAELLFTGGTKAWRGCIANTRGEKRVFIGGQMWAFKQVAVPALGELIDPSDDFTRGDEDPIASPWAHCTGSVGNARLVSNQMAGPSTNNDTFVYYSGAAGTSNHFSEFVLKNKAIDNDWGVGVRVQSGERTMYFFNVFEGDGATRCQKWLNNSLSTVEALATTTFAVDDVLLCSVDGDTITCKRNGTELGNSPSTDTSIPSGGQPGAFIFESAIKLDSFRGGDGDGTAVDIPPPGANRPNIALQQRAA